MSTRYSATRAHRRVPVRELAALAGALLLAQQSFAANVTIDFDDQGVATKASIGDLNGVLKPAERACVTEGLLASRAACPGTATISGIGSMLFSITKP